MTSNPEQFEIALSLHRDGQFEEAQALYRQIVTDHPDHAEVFHLLGLIAFQTGDLDTALREIEHAIDLDATDPHFFNNLGLIYKTQGNFEEALHQFEVAVRIQPKLAGAWSNMGLTYQHQDRFEEALHSYLKAVALDPTHADFYNQLGGLMQTQSRFEDAIAYYRQALQHNPDLLEAQNNMALCLVETGHLAEALAAYDVALRLRPESTEVLYNKALALSLNGQDEAALECYRQLLDLDENQPIVSFKIGVLLQQLGQYEAAIGYFLKTLSSLPEYGDAAANLGRSLYVMGHLDQATAWFEKAIQLDPACSAAYNNLGLLYMDTGPLELAAQYLSTAVNLMPDGMDAYINYGAVLHKLGRLDDAIQCYQKAMTLNPQCGWAYNNLGTLYRDQGRMPQALEMFRKALELDPAYTAALNNLGLTCKDLFKLEEALEYFQQGLNLEPNNYELLMNAGDGLLNAGETDRALALFERAYTLKPNESIRMIKETLLPRLYSSVEDIHFWRNRFETNIRRIAENPFKSSYDPIAETGTANFYLAYHGLNDRDLQAQIAGLYAHLEMRVTAVHTPNPKPRIGFVSRFFSPNHTIGRLMLGILNHLSREKFEVVVFTIGTPEPPPIASAHRHIDLYANNLKQAQQRIADENLDVLFYPDIGMEPLTYFLCFSRLAPVQCVTWGHPVTTGIDTVDYFISGHLLEAEDAQKHYTEKLVLLDTLPTYYQRPEQSLQFSREHFGFQPDEHIYLCPQSLFKFHPGFDETLGNILRQDEKGVLVLINPYYKIWNRILMERFQTTIPDVCTRIRILDKMSWLEFVSMLAQADVILDTPFFGGGNTTYEAFAVGTPIVTFPAEYMRGRVTAACYRKMGIGECIAPNLEDYTRIALHLGKDVDARKQLREKILAANHVLYEDRRAVEALETFFLQALEAALPQAISTGSP